MATSKQTSSDRTKTTTTKKDEAPTPEEPEGIVAERNRLALWRDELNAKVQAIAALTTAWDSAKRNLAEARKILDSAHDELCDLAGNARSPTLFDQDEAAADDAKAVVIERNTPEQTRRTLAGQHQVSLDILQRQSLLHVPIKVDRLYVIAVGGDPDGDVLQVRTVEPCEDGEDGAPYAFKYPIGHRDARRSQWFKFGSGVLTV
jgi:hypothetical protein